MLVVTDNSPLSALAMTGWLGLLKTRWEQVAVPSAVWEESRLIPSAAARKRLDDARSEGWLIVRQVSDAMLVHSLSARLDAGESEAIALAVELNADWLLMDELKGRSVAKEYGLHITGTLGLLIWARVSGHLSSLREAIQRIESEGELYLTDELKAVALEAVGEVR